YFFADFVSGWIRKLDPERGNFVTGFASNLPSPVDLKVDSAGDLLYLARGGGGLGVKVQFVGTAASANQRFVNQTYLDLLQRPADPTGLAGWTNALTNGASRGQIIQAIQASLEYRQDVIDDLYGTYLHRKPDTAGRDGWVNLLGQGASLSSIRALFLGSAEYFQMRGQ